MTKSNEQLTTELQNLKNQVEAISAQLYELRQSVNSRPQRSDLARSESSLNESIRTNAEIINKIAQKLAQISLPADTRYYLSQSEISDFRANFNKLLAMMAAFDQQYQSLVAYSINNTGT